MGAGETPREGWPGDAAAARFWPYLLDSLGIARCVKLIPWKPARREPLQHPDLRWLARLEGIEPPTHGLEVREGALRPRGTKRDGV